MSDSEWRPEWRRKTQAERERDAPKKKKQGVDLLRAIANDAMMHPTPLPSREELRARCIRGLLAIAENDEVDVRARAVSFKAVLDHTDKVADREEDYSRQTDEELRAKILKLAKSVVTAAAASKALPEHIEEPVTEHDSA